MLLSYLLQMDILANAEKKGWSFSTGAFKYLLHINVYGSITQDWKHSLQKQYSHC